MTTTTETGTGTIEIRMYNVGFGDAFRITVRRGGQTWRMLVDCGVHSQGAARPLKESVKNIISDLKQDCGGTPHLDVVVATHHHRDHIRGFAADDWTEVEVDEVWVPFVEDETDEDAKRLRAAQTATARKLAALIGERRNKLAANTKAMEMLTLAMAMAHNSRGNARATDRLLGRGITFAKQKHAVRYLPDIDKSNNTIRFDKCGVVAHILGPPRDAAMLKKMDPPKNAGWLTLNLDDVVDAQVDDDEDEQDTVATNGKATTPSDGDKPESDWRLFNKSFVLTDLTHVPAELVDAKRKLRLHALGNDIGLLAAASVLEQSVNNTSLFFVLDVAGVRLLFPGDAQYGAWESVRNDPKSLDLISNVDFYKMGHHGSHNATPMSFIEKQWKKPGDTMVPWGLVKLWKDSIPYTELIDALTAKQHRVIKPNKDTVGVNPASELVETEWWSQLTFKVGDRSVEEHTDLS
jgi:beta-lactamase superfamily II metal-dependent hydrolase